MSGEVRRRKDGLGSTNLRETGVLKRYEQGLMPKESRLTEADVWGGQVQWEPEVGQQLYAQGWSSMPYL